MALPKRKHSHSRTHKRRSQFKVKKPTLTRCPNCGAAVPPHCVCSECGWYRGIPTVAGRTS